MKTDFHIYPSPADEKFTTVMDIHDPQAYEILLKMSDIFNQHGRAREADECLDAAHGLAAGDSE